jgi:heme a synthase
MSARSSTDSNAGKAALASFNAGLHRLAMLVTIATLPLIVIGGLVTSHHAGLAVPDWPNSYGYNMFLFPPRFWVGGILYEHTHRLAATVIGMLSILLCAWAWFSDKRPRVRWLCTAVLAGVIFQGILGGLRVVFVNLDLAIVHGCVAQAFFCLAASTAVLTSRWWSEAPDLTDAPDSRPGRQLTWLCLAAVAVVYLQLIVGATMRHEGAGLAVPDVPWIYGKLWPPSDAAGLKAANDLRVWQLNLPPVTLGQIWLHYAHRVGALAVTLVLIALVLHVLYWHRHRRGLLWPAIALIPLLAAQITLGILTVYYRKPADVASAHVAVGALVLVTCFVLTLRSAKLYSWRAAPAENWRDQADLGKLPAHA